MSMKIEVKGKTWPEKYQKILDWVEELAKIAMGYIAAE